MSNRHDSANRVPIMAAASSNPWDCVRRGTYAEREQIDLRKSFLFPELAPKSPEPAPLAAFSLQGDPTDLAQRLTVHVVTSTLMLFALPAGLAVMAYNVAFGEDMRRTAHFIALTGMAMSLAQAGMI